MGEDADPIDNIVYIPNAQTQRTKGTSASGAWFRQMTDFYKQPIMVPDRASAVYADPHIEQTQSQYEQWYAFAHKVRGQLQQAAQSEESWDSSNIFAKAIKLKLLTKQDKQLWDFLFNTEINLGSVQSRAALRGQSDPFGLGHHVSVHSFANYKTAQEQLYTHEY